LVLVPREERAPPWYPFKFKNSNKNYNFLALVSGRRGLRPGTLLNSKTVINNYNFSVLIPGRRGLRPGTLLNSKTVINNYNFSVPVPREERAPPWYPFKFKSSNKQLQLFGTCIFEDFTLILQSP
jgi:hypothetical protein